IGDHGGVEEAVGEEDPEREFGDEEVTEDDVGGGGEEIDGDADPEGDVATAFGGVEESFKFRVSSFRICGRVFRTAAEGGEDVVEADEGDGDGEADAEGEVDVDMVGVGGVDGV